MSSSHDLRPSAREAKFCFILLLPLLAILWFFPAAGRLGVNGLALMLGGCLLVFSPGPHLVGRHVWVTAAVYLVLALLAFLPISSGNLPAWRASLDALGVSLGEQITPVASTSWRLWGIKAGLVVIAVGLLRHRVEDAAHRGFALCFALLVAAYGGVAMVADFMKLSFSWDMEPSFGFFANRNHTATLLAMGGLVSAGCLFQAVRMRNNLHSSLASVALALCLAATLGFNESRAGFLLLALGGGLWVAFLGKRYFSLRTVGIFAVIVAVAGVLFLRSNSRVKERLVESVDQFKLVKDGANNGQFAPGVPANAQIDSRVLIYEDTAKLIATAPVTGVGLGAYQEVFPYFRAKSASLARILHPESLWLMVAAEEGLPAALALLVLVCLTWGFGLLRHRKLSHWPLRWACMLAAALVPIHCLVDVPAVHPGLVLGSLFLFGISLRPHQSSAPAESDSGAEKVDAVSAAELEARSERKRARKHASALQGLIVKSLGGVVALVGAFFIWGQWLGDSPMPEEVAKIQLAKARTLIEQDAVEQAVTNHAPRYIPPEEDKLEMAIKELDLGIAAYPLAEDLHFQKASVAARFSDMQDRVENGYAVQRLLSPQSVVIPLHQLPNWSVLAPEKMITLWEDGLARAHEMAKLSPGRDMEEIHVVLHPIYHTPKANLLMRHIFPRTLKHPAAALAWSAAAAPELLDELLPQAMESSTLNAETKAAMRQNWINRGDQIKARQHSP